MAFNKMGIKMPALDASLIGKQILHFFGNSDEAGDQFVQFKAKAGKATLHNDAAGGSARVGHFRYRLKYHTADISGIRLRSADYAPRRSRHA